jgi:hypothetical protein
MMRPSAVRAATALLLGLAALAVPTASVVACSCASLGNSPADAATSAAGNGDLAFIGTVVGTRPVPPELGTGPGDVVGYAFEVERATAPVAATIEVRALNDPGGASCGFVFGTDEEWFVTAYSDGGNLHTGLCSGNQRVDAIDADAAERLVEVLPEVSVPDDDGGDVASAPGPWLALAVVAAFVVLLGGVIAVAFRRGGVS